MPALLVITGTSRGLGEAVAREAVEAGHTVLGLARSPARYGHALHADLTELPALAPLLRDALAAQPLDRFERIALINNAAMLGPVGTRFDAADVQTHLATNLAAPIVLCRTFIDTLAERAVPKRIVNLSSGASTTAFHGWSLYCAAKAGLDHFGRCLALEQASAAHPVDVLALSPGVIDTGMQEQIRASSSTDFPEHDRFVALAAEGMLADPAEVARIVLAAALADARYAGATCRLHELP